MAVTITKRPEIELEGGFVSRWNSVHHPITFEMLGSPYDPVARPNYGIIVQVLEYGTETLLGETKRMKPFPGKPLPVNVSGYLSNYMKKNFTTSMKRGDINKRDIGKSVEFYIKVADAWDGQEPVFYSDPYTYFGCTTKPQVGSKYGGNLAEYLPVYGNATPDNKAKFLTTFENPVYFRGYPFTLSFIYPVEMRNVDMQLVENQEGDDGENQVLRGLDKRQMNGINKIRFEEPPPNVKKIVATTRTGQTADTDYFLPGYINDGYID